MEGRGGEEGTGGRGGGGRAYSFAVCRSRLTIDIASLSRRSAVCTATRDTFNIRAFISFFSVYYKGGGGGLTR